MKFSKYCLALIAVLGGCEVAGRLDVKDQYTKDVRRLDLSPVYPPSETYQIGDVYMILRKLDATDGKPSTQDRDTKTIRIGNLDWVRQEAQVELGQRIAFKDTALLEKSKDAGIGQDDLPSTNLLRTGQVKGAVSLPSVAFPKVTGDAGQEFGFAPAGILGLRLFGARRTTVSLDLGDVRSLAAPKVTVANRMNDSSAFAGLQSGCVEAIGILKELVERDAAPSAKAESNPEKDVTHVDVEFLVVNQVFLTRQITYTFTNRAIAAATRQSLAKGATGTAVYGPTVVLGANNTGTAKDLSDALVALNQQNTVGFSAAGFNENGITLTRTFQKPVAVAYDGIQRKILGHANLDSLGNQPAAVCAAAKFKDAERTPSVPLPIGNGRILGITPRNNL